MNVLDIMKKYDEQKKELIRLQGELEDYVKRLLNGEIELSSGEARSVVATTIQSIEQLKDSINKILLDTVSLLKEKMRKKELLFKRQTEDDELVPWTSYEEEEKCKLFAFITKKESLKEFSFEEASWLKTVVNDVYSFNLEEFKMNTKSGMCR